MYNFSLPPHYVHQLGQEYYTPPYPNADYDDYRWNWLNWWSAQMFSLPPDPRMAKQLMSAQEGGPPFAAGGMENYLASSDRAFYPTKPTFAKPAPTMAKRETQVLKNAKKKEKLINKVEFKANPKVNAVTTLMLRNIPNKYCQRELLEDLDSYGFLPGEHMDFFYLPIDPVTGANLGYAFVNFTNQDVTEKFRQDINRKQLPRHLTRKIIEVGDAAVQGFEQNQQYYSRSSAVRNLDASRRPLFWNEQGETINEQGEVQEIEDTSVEQDEEARFEQDWTSTLMLRNLRNKFSQTDLLKELELLGFVPRESIDFFYLPIDTNTNANLGYAFVNFTGPHIVEQFKELSGQKLSRIFKQNVVVVDEASVQGIQANWDLYIRSAPINSSDPLRRPLFWPKTTLKGRSEAWDGNSTNVSSGRRSQTSSQAGSSAGRISAMARAETISTSSSIVPPGLDSDPVRRPPGLDDEEEEGEKFPHVFVCIPPGLDE